MRWDAIARWREDLAAKPAAGAELPPGPAQQIAVQLLRPLHRLRRRGLRWQKTTPQLRVVCERHRQQLEGVLKPFEPLGQGIEARSDEVDVTSFACQEALICLFRERAACPSPRGCIGLDLLPQLGVDVGLLSDFVTHLLLLLLVCWLAFSATGRQKRPAFF